MSAASTGRRNANRFFSLTRAVTVGVLLLILTGTIRAQFDASIHPTVRSLALSSAILGDTVSGVMKVEVPASDSTRVGLRRNPTLAMGLSAIAPGGGQIYNGSWLKAAAVWGASGYFVSQWITNDKSYRQYRDQFTQSLVSNPGSGDIQIQSLRDFYRDQRDSFAWYLGIVYALQILDAYVDASLSGFDVSPNLGPQQYSGISVRIPIGKSP